jgi:two-component system sensor histidine kinase/response regulator
LGGMQMTVRLLRDRAQAHDDERLSRIAANVLHATDQMFSFVKEFLANSAADRALALSLEPICLDQAVAAAVQHYAEAARRKSIALLHERSADFVVSADRKALDQVLDNLISNAVKFSPLGKTVRVSVEPDPPGGGILRVQDEGPGFSDEDKMRMFRRYCRLSAQPTAGEPSTGLGLSIVSKLVHAMGGTLTCQSTLGEGATFILHLPRAATEAS